ncbi:MAG: hypothetical protein ACREX4_18720 [Gammaproteobacteria bacterium]
MPLGNGLWHDYQGPKSLGAKEPLRHRHRVVYRRPPEVALQVEGDDVGLGVPLRVRRPHADWVPGTGFQPTFHCRQAKGMFFLLRVASVQLRRRS